MGNEYPRGLSFLPTSQELREEQETFYSSFCAPSPDTKIFHYEDVDYSDGFDVGIFFEDDKPNKRRTKKRSKKVSQDRTLADRADATPRKVRFGPGIGGLLEDQLSMFDLVIQNDKQRLTKKYKDMMDETELIMKRCSDSRTETSEFWIKKYFPKEQYESMLIFGYDPSKTIEENKEQVYELNKYEIKKSPLFRRRVKAFFKRLESGTLYNPD